jgi:hypothetical protein
MTANGFAVVLLLIALIFAGMGWRMLKTDKENSRLAVASAAWATAAGQIETVRIDTSYDNVSNTEIVQDTYVPKVDYSYTVEGKQYVGTRINFVRQHYARENKAKAVVANYTMGAAVMIAYDPADPQNSVLDRSTKPPAIGFWTGLSFLMAVIVAGLGVGMFFIPN